MSPRGLRKQIVTSNTKDLPEKTAQRLSGVYGSVDELIISLNVDSLKDHLNEKYGSSENWMPRLQELLEAHEQLDRWRVEAVKRVIQEVNGKEATG